MKPFVYSACRFILRPFVTLFYKPKVIGIENLPKDKPIILAGNHTCLRDPFIVGYITNDDLYYIVKKELHEGIIKPFFKYSGTIPVDRKNKGNENAFKAVLDILKENKKVVIFPEGTINKTNDIIMPFKYGAVSLAKKSGAYIVPFGIKGRLKIFRRTVSISLGKPYKITKDLEYENKKLEQKVINLLKEK